ncbi:hypothetical protein [Pontiella agarivorans]|uniref:Uncharacterized protein n=1 Tax=Pontiella agarivorans TaxID=3038953 RepID=A0ABU5MVB2_9BACT|nr:hypothetical protein [Pontiella agarivorans]MDZ8118120.1 hypothetical protein [Pontiella agarivorans]
MKLYLPILEILILHTLTAGNAAHAQIPDAPQPQHNKFAIELFRIESPNPFEEARFLKQNISIPELFENAQNRINTYPVLYSALGIPAICDQTKCVHMAENYNIKDGKAVPVKSKVELGMRTKVTIRKLENNMATYELEFSNKELKGYEEVILKNDIHVKLPRFETRQINTELNQSLGSWLVLGGLSGSGDNGIHSTYYIIRITRPMGMSRY